ncbi:hypothetical protein [Paenibacillus sp. S150]|uniref:hypothetical protein n=1 Tax=Paenibacillus sp. S150 TaxID=2749826 RepID=UPI001C5A44B8|nr:hypothetical protein [Paenibacillus sp. S150]MBW4083108.1 hypothetical protein [Paenibacillus sp. S150]
MNRRTFIARIGTVVLAASLALNVYFYTRNQDLHNSLSLQRTSEQSNTAEGEVYTQNVAEMIHLISTLEQAKNSDSGEVDAEQLYKLRMNILKLPEVEEKLAFVKNLSNSGGAVQLDLDEVEWFSGDEAEAAAKKDGKPDEGSLANGFYIRNSSEDIESVVLEPEVLIAELDGARLKYVPFNDFITSEVKERLFRITAVGEKVVMLEEAYRP